MGRGKHQTHKKTRVSIGTKLPAPLWLELTEKKPEVIFNTAKYMRNLILRDLNKELEI